MKVGILITDSVREELLEQHGDYPDMFEKLLMAADSHLEISRHWIQTKIPEAIDCDGYVITGSRYSVYDDVPWILELVEFLKKVLAAEKKIVGVCFGHQLMAHFFGGLAEKADQGWAVGVHKSEVVVLQPWMAGGALIQSDVSLLSSHQDQVMRLPEKAVTYVTNDFCPIAGFVIDDQVLTIQGHPEFSKEYASALLDLRRPILGEKLFVDGQASLTKPTDEAPVALWFVNFLRGGDVGAKSMRRLHPFMTRAEKLIGKRRSLSALLDRAIKKLNRVGRRSFGESWEELLLFVQLLRDWSAGDYRDISNKSLILVVASLLYFVAPFDAIPDFLFGWGYLDDLAILRMVVKVIKAELEKFKEWKKTQ